MAYLRSLGLDLSHPYDEIQGLCEVAASVANVPIAIVTLITEDEQIFLANVGLGDLKGTPREASFCAHAIVNSSQTEIPDTHCDVRFSSNPFVVEDPKVRSYLGAVLEPEAEIRLGTVCVIDTVPRTHSEQTKEALSKIGAAITAILVSHRQNLDLVDHSQKLDAQNAEMNGLNASLRHKTEKLIAAEQARNTFLSTISHELRTPLTSIKGALGLLKFGGLDFPPERFDQLITIANQNSDKLLSLVNDILEIQKGTFETNRASFVPVDLFGLVEEAVSSYQSYAADKGVSLTFTASTHHACVVQGDSKQLDRVMANLLSNAFKFSDPGGQVEVDLNYVEGEPQISVTDHGVGIPEGAEDMVFGLFTQVDNSDTRPAGGTGLGMHICRQILTQHNATISYKSTLGEGTTFIVKFKTSTT
ncbi:sensor histidine kinase [Celeribacter halophilus]|uniref:sensor histidine kinase n=1 Tax=Celeribacter halophilus TaxID=576117 RepID=UPI001C0A4196|nr:HAMP domain-containing sensor histidine kinase [Celeribacter halophilus]MBU2888879.1 HAMP domain-containing histidine kinase [Celeribacter halophilus]MDO6511997.1 HAMP domain-containing sensor histidine kinase [Celeribacter halophilus]